MPPDRPVRLTVASVEPGFAEIKADGAVVGIAFADFYMRWTVRLFPAPGQRIRDAVEPFRLGSLVLVRAEVRRMLAEEGPWWSETAATGRAT